MGTESRDTSDENSPFVCGTLYVKPSTSLVFYAKTRLTQAFVYLAGPYIERVAQVLFGPKSKRSVAPWMNLDSDEANLNFKFKFNLNIIV